jgi:hypothetical protein
MRDLISGRDPGGKKAPGHATEGVTTMTAMTIDAIATGFVLGRGIRG